MLGEVLGSRGLPTVIGVKFQEGEGCKEEESVKEMGLAGRTCLNLSRWKGSSPSLAEVAHLGAHMIGGRGMRHSWQCRLVLSNPKLAVHAFSSIQCFWAHAL